MSGIDFSQKLNYQRKYRQYHVDPNDEEQVIRQFESDRGRIMNSAAIRRLQQKTQVFPLENNAAVRSRLTHSLEVQQVGRYISKTIINELKTRNLLADYGLDKRLLSFESLIEMACLMHDIGNPPFGHFGEAAIKDWFAKKLDLNFSLENIKREDRCEISALRLCGDVKKDRFRRQLRKDLCQFEGNAQAIRMVHSLLKLNLTYAQLGCILKYTCPAFRLEEIPNQFNYLMKKPGFYWSEEHFVCELRRELKMGEFCRFPLTYIMEAADDISYCIADLDDAVEKAIFSVDTLMGYLEQEWQENGGHRAGDLFDLTVRKAYKGTHGNELRRSQQDQFFMYLRVYITGKLVPYTARRFIDHLPAVFEGSFNQALLEDKSEEHRLLRTLKNIACKRVFNHPEIEKLELQGYRIINGLLDFYYPLLKMPRQDFVELNQNNFHKDYFMETRLLHKLSTKHRLAYGEAVEKIVATDQAEKDLLEFYYRARLIQDYISGMTDNYVYEEYRKFIVCT
ncbi:dGTPase [Photorhabdus laumondii subsp. laumondii]|uniref:Deoxyguanosinetriphosphate triphosphohydrolase n=2 Tax=Photorhabdus laumondii subsp. laumondii TaxID=141679 RepID=Q7MB72_PHOLL|nr:MULTISPECIES: dGTPase [Photorhabdus]AXG46173.1 dGTPase [Photorhabdus laumondii subsp. laumondii]KTL61959.1 deoxyguanosinetriphosphate triphosphohydrolase [Photorhabdus laumondii subsp. laumondii]MCC8383049.1 dGTPase [Photorhabdus laumondii]MCC8411890.1 dGTPase [Photorhabdus laumondii]NDK95827.1 dGTPase [Photorhabdus laumondii subsp. laumondii]